MDLQPVAALQLLLSPSAAAPPVRAPPAAPLVASPRLPTPPGATWASGEKVAVRARGSVHDVPPGVADDVAAGSKAPSVRATGARGGGGSTLSPPPVSADGGNTVGPLLATAVAVDVDDAASTATASIASSSIAPASGKARSPPAGLEAEGECASLWKRDPGCACK